MDQIIQQLQQQLQRLQQEVNGINQVCSQLQQSEQANALQLQQMTQKEMVASQGLRRIQQSAGLLNQELSQISNITQQMVNQLTPFQRAIQTTGVAPGAYSALTGITGQTSAFYPQTGNIGFNQPTTGTFGTTQYGAFGQGAASQFGFNQGQNLSNIGSIPSFNLGAYSTQQPYSQGYSPSQFGTGSQLGTTQAFSGMGQMGTGTQQQGQNYSLSGFGGASQTGIPNQQLGSSNLLGVMSPVMQNMGGLAGSQTSNLGTSIGQSSQGQAAGLYSYSPYQANQFGFR